MATATSKVFVKCEAIMTPVAIFVANQDRKEVNEAVQQLAVYARPSSPFSSGGWSLDYED